MDLFVTICYEVSLLIVIIFCGNSKGAVAGGGKFMHFREFKFLLK